jgi:hypothetical protein
LVALKNIPEQTHVFIVFSSLVILASDNMEKEKQYEQNDQTVICILIIQLQFESIHIYTPINSYSIWFYLFV